MRRSVVMALVVFMSFAMVTPALGQGGESTLHYFGAAIGLGIIVVGAGYGIGRFTMAAAESIARQPEAAAQITAAINLPLFLLEGVAILGEVFCLLIVLMK
ncbi:MAG: ATP synthase F0 subunit C [Fidelibacterota bacterium]